MAKNVTNDSRGRTFATVVYPDSAPEHWQDILLEHHIPAFISPLHDKDTNPTGEAKKPHYHVMIMYEGKKSLTQAQEVFDTINGVGCIVVADKRGMARYFTHMDNPEKHRYDTNDVVAMSGADYNYTIGVVVDKYRVIDEMLEFIENNCVVSYWNLLSYARRYNQEWYRALCDNCSYVIQEAIKSYKWTLEQNMTMNFANEKIELKNMKNNAVDDNGSVDEGHRSV